MLTGQDYYRYFQCPHWPYWERFGKPEDRRPLTEAEEQRLADGLQHERRVVKEQFGAFREIKVHDREEGFRRTRALMEKGTPLIYQGWLVDGEWVGRPDILERREGTSRFGAWHYVPVDVKRSHELKKEHLAQLTFYAVLLERIQGRFPREPAIVNGDGERLVFDASDFRAEFDAITERLERLIAGEMPEPVYRKACVDTSPWGAACLRLASERNDIALLFNVDVRKLAALRSVGVRTVAEAARLDPEALEGKAPGLTRRGLTLVKQQAESLEGRLVIIREAFGHAPEGLEIHFDIESHPPTDTDYLYGFWIRDPGKERYVSFLSERPTGEKKLWRAFLAWLPTLPAHYTVYHYANYEPARLTVLAKRYGDEGDPWLARFRERLVDLKELAREHVVFPLPFYSLKMIGKFLGFGWKGEVQGGGESVVAYDKWLATRRRAVLESIRQYNEEDVRATAFLRDWLSTYARTPMAYREPYPWVRRS